MMNNKTHQMKSKITGVILASGEGSRMKQLSSKMGLPKHLFPLGDTTVVSRIARELSSFCDEVICVVPEHYIKHFSENFQNKVPGVKVVTKRFKGFKGDFTAAYEEAAHRHVVITVGDLVFPDGEIRHFMERTEPFREKLIAAFDKKRLRVLTFPTIVDFRMVLACMPKDLLKMIIETDPESPLSVLRRLVKLILMDKLKLVAADTLFNLNTPESYEKAINYFTC